MKNSQSDYVTRLILTSQKTRTFGSRPWTQRALQGVLALSMLSVQPSFADAPTSPSSNLSSALQEVLMSSGFETARHSSNTSSNDKPVSARTLIDAELAWKKGRYAQAAELWKEVAVQTRDLEVADWAAKAAAKSGQVDIMAQVGGVWRWAHGGLGVSASDIRVPLGPTPERAFFAGLLSVDGYMQLAFAPSGAQGAEGPDLFEKAFQDWCSSRTDPSHPFAIEQARLARTTQNTWSTDDETLNRWMNRLPDYRAEIIQEVMAHRQGRWSEKLHSQLWSFVEAGGDEENRQAVRDLAQEMATPRPGIRQKVSSLPPMSPTAPDNALSSSKTRRLRM